jgi:hypothetical protein
LKEESDTIRMACDDWAEAELIKKLLTQSKSYWMEGARA